MKTKEFKIQIPEGYEIDQENSTFECIKFKPKRLTYEKIAKELFETKETFWATSYGVVSCNCDGVKGAYADATNCTSEKQVHKLLAINKLMNVAKYLNNGWKPNWEDSCEDKWYLKIVDDELLPELNYVCMCGDIYFKSRDAILQAIEILGEDIISSAFSTDW